MTKTEMARDIARLLAPGNTREQDRLARYHAGRPVESVRETYDRVQALEHVSKAEIARHCQTYRPRGVKA